MKIGYIGLGKMGLGMVELLLEKGYEVVAYNRSPEPTKEAEGHGATGAYGLKELVAHLETPRTLWLMVPHQAVDAVLAELTPLLAGGDTVIDGGNSFFEESIRRHGELSAIGINFLDAGISGGPSGARNGACIMVGGQKEVAEKYTVLFTDLALPGGYAYVGDGGAGHFVKMVHNGIEYGMMQAIGEGFELMKKSPFHVPLEAVANLYQHGSVIESRLVGWLLSGYKTYGVDLDAISGSIANSGEGAWTVETAKKYNIPVPVIEDSLQFRIDSQEKPSYTGQVVSVMRNQFGGHEVKKKE